MWKSIIYKEWLKTRWFFIISAALGVLVIGYIFLKVHHDVKFNDPNNYWYVILFMKVKYFSILKFLPIVIGLAISVAQYFPETVDKRIKLSFHLPINENKILLIMMLFGTAILLTCYALLTSIFYVLSAVYFPSDIILPALVTITPWYLAGFAIYYLVAFIILEPMWKYRFSYTIFAVSIFPVFLESAIAGGTAPVNLFLVIIVVGLSISLLFSGYRFRKGEM